ncbi:DUF4233 domain-containing protein [Williamsia deligens]|uniref:DUF4233 domain-containing protein n=1 Tax=Williamsia deligens TaxID=321325 RepID=A0ABW3GCF2_9NOCA|nr:DUF4233 domain-containing protein [Williamsia deligens]MCP2195583.1 Protein of unknown function (DUF4233) [Williamsia deligens]
MTSSDAGSASGSAPRFSPPVNDPWRGLRGVMAGTLILEAIVVLLALPIVAKVGGGLTAASTTFLLVVTVAMILGSGLQGRSWALGYDLLLQVLLIAGFVLHWSIGAVGIVFALVWVYIAYIRRDVARRIEEGRLPGQVRLDGSGTPEDAGDVSDS